MSNDTIKKHSRSLEKDYAILPRDLAKDKRLTPFSRLVLLYLLSNSDTWVVRTEFAAFEIGVNRKTFTNAIRELYNTGFIARERIRLPNGHFSHFEYEFSHEPIFENPKWQEPKKRVTKKSAEIANVDESCPNPAELSIQALQPQATKPPVVKQSVVNAPLPMPNKPMPNLKAMVAMPASSKRSKALEASPDKREFPKSKSRVKPRTPEHEERFQYMLGLKIGNEKKGYLDEDAASFLSKDKTYAQIENAYFTLKTKQRKGDRVDNPAALFRHLLLNEHNPNTPQSEINETFAREFSNHFNWTSLVIKGKFVYDKNNSSKDLNLNMPFESFQSSLHGLYSSCCNG